MEGRERKVQPKINFDEIMFRENPIIKEPGVKDYFDSLPDFVKETIMQSGVEIESESHLRQLADHFIKESKNKGKQ